MGTGTVFEMKILMVIIMSALFGCSLKTYDINVTIMSGPEPNAGGTSLSTLKEIPAVETSARRSGSGNSVHINIADPAKTDATLPVTIPVKPF